MGKKINRQEKKKEFIKMLLSVDKDQMEEFIKQKGHEPKKIKPFICLYNQ